MELVIRSGLIVLATAFSLESFAQNAPVDPGLDAALNYQLSASNPPAKKSYGFCEAPPPVGANVQQQQVFHVCNAHCRNAATQAGILTSAAKKEDSLLKNFKQGKSIMDVQHAGILKAATGCESFARGDVSNNFQQKNVIPARGSVLNGSVGAEGEVSEPAQYTRCAGNPGSEQEMAAQRACDGLVTRVVSAMRTDAASAKMMAAQYKKGMKIVMGAGAGVAGALILDNIQDEKKAKKERDNAANEYANGIITNDDGTKTQCFTPDNANKTECTETMTRLCQGDKATKAGCVSFNGNYCSGEGATSNYCLSREAVDYCKPNNSVVNQSPACKWNTQRAASCKKEPENVECLYSSTKDALNLACANYPNDPLCKAHKAGRVVIAGGVEPIKTDNGAATVNVGQVTAPSTSGSTTSSSTAAGYDPNLLPPATNLWTSNTNGVQQTCQAGNLVGCQ